MVSWWRGRKLHVLSPLAPLLSTYICNMRCQLQLTVVLGTTLRIERYIQPSISSSLHLGLHQAIPMTIPDNLCFSYLTASDSILASDNYFRISYYPGPLNAPGVVLVLERGVYLHTHIGGIWEYSRSEKSAL